MLLEVVFCLHLSIHVHRRDWEDIRGSFLEEIYEKHFVKQYSRIFIDI